MMERLTTNCPDNNLDAALNLFYVKDCETWVRGGGDGPDYPDIRLYDFIRKAAKILLPDLDFPMDDDGVDYAMGELLLDGPDEPTGLLALLYTAAWSYAELRGRLMQYEDTGLMPEEFTAYWAFIQDLIGDQKASEALSNFRKLAEADKDGRVVVLPCKVGDVVYGFYGEKTILPMVAKWIETNTDGWCIAVQYVPMAPRFYRFSDFGKTVFLTRKEAEAALEAKRDD